MSEQLAFPFMDEIETEDGLVTEVTDILNNNLHASCECHECVITWSDSDAIPLLVELICTEKLKLLAEVRERVVGDELPLPDEVMARTGTLLYNKIKFEQREELTKLEAEL